MERTVAAIGELYERALGKLRAEVKTGEKLDRKKLEKRQVAAHALAYMATELEAARQMLAWSKAVGGAYEKSMAEAYIGEVARTLATGVELGACESIDVRELGVSEDDIRATVGAPDVLAFSAKHATSARYIEIAAHAKDNGYGALGLGDPILEDVRDQFAKFTDNEVIPAAQDIHRQDKLIPMEMIEQLGEMGVFGLTIPEQYSGLGMGKVAMCVVTEELSRGYIGVGSLGTRSEIAAELIMHGGTQAQKKKYLSRIASGELLPTAVFTEPNTGSDLASLKTRAVLEGDVYKIQGNKTWITHAARADIMTLLARSDASKPGYQGLSMFLAEKPRGTEADPFPAKGMSGGEIRVLGYRGMKEYEIGFDGFEVPAANLLGEKEGQGFKQLMATFESARIQTAAR